MTQHYKQHVSACFRTGNPLTGATAAGWPRPHSREVGAPSPAPTGEATGAASLESILCGGAGRPPVSTPGESLPRGFEMKKGDSPGDASAEDPGARLSIPGARLSIPVSSVRHHTSAEYDAEVIDCTREVVVAAGEVETFALPTCSSLDNRVTSMCALRNQSSLDPVDTGVIEDSVIDPRSNFGVEQATADDNGTCIVVIDGTCVDVSGCEVSGKGQLLRGGDGGHVDSANKLLVGDGGLVHKKRYSIAERRAAKKLQRVVKPVETDMDRADALRGYESFYQLPHGSATLVQVAESSAGVSGWTQFARGLDAGRKDCRDEKLIDIKKQKLQNTLLRTLGVAEELVGKEEAKHVEFEEVEQPKTKGLHIFEVVDPTSDSSVLANEAAWQDVEFEVALDAGSQDHVCDEVDCPGYVTQPSPGSSRGQCFIVGDGGRLENLGQRSLNLQPINDATMDLQSCFQIARVTRPLMSVGRICDNGLNVTFDEAKAVVSTKEGAQICVFERKPGGLYTGKFRLKRPSSGFARQG